MASLSGQVIAVTGAGRGIGHAIVQRLITLGVHVAALDLTLGGGGGIGGGGGGGGIVRPASVFQTDQALELYCDVTCEESVVAAFAAIWTKFGSLYGLVNNAGIVMEKPLLETTMDDFDRVVAVNLRGTFLCGKVAVMYLMRTTTTTGDEPPPDRPLMMPARIVNVASELAHCGLANYSAYTASKGGISSLTKSWALELAPHRILVNTVAPGPTDTPMLQSETNYSNWKNGEGIPLGRLATPDDIAKAVCFLLGPDSTFMTGSTVDVNGGAVMY
jgi:3-oxoacyl-[acyl-carrier protein] reductase